MRFPWGGDGEHFKTTRNRALKLTKPARGAKTELDLAQRRSAIFSTVSPLDWCDGSTNMSSN